jgi:hypothetical protein
LTRLIQGYANGAGGLHKPGRRASYGIGWHQEMIIVSVGRDTRPALPFGERIISRIRARHQDLGIALNH